MSSWGLVAIKARSECKGRLAASLQPPARLALARLMLDAVLTALRDARTVEHVAVVTPERDTVPPDVLVIEDRGRGLNAALEYARSTLVDLGAGELVVLPADLPLVTASDVDLLVRRGRRTGLALACDAAGHGTNALYLAPPAPFRFAFGPESCSRHLEEAARLSRVPDVVRSPRLGFDVDRDVDLVSLRELGDARFVPLFRSADGEPWRRQMHCG